MTVPAKPRSVADHRIPTDNHSGGLHANIDEETSRRRPLAHEAETDLRGRIEVILDQVSPTSVPSMSDFSSREYDERGQPW